MQWRKQGLILGPQPRLAWMQTHAMVPLADHIGGDRYRIYFSGRDRDNRSHIGYAEIGLDRPERILTVSELPVLSPGELGCFDDSGVTPSWLVDHDGVKYLYYIGWQPRSRVRLGLMIGLALSHDGGVTFQRYSRAPLLPRTDHEPFALLTAPCVLLDGGVWRMWYVSADLWQSPDEPRYNIKYAESADGINWRREGHVCIDYAAPEETALARPCVLKEDGIYRMWYSYKQGNYRIGYAESADGLTWQRLDADAGISAAASGWDSEMLEYAYVFDHRGTKYMLYNGNAYGRDGFGLAVGE
jgi:hypothetical protein